MCDGKGPTVTLGQLTSSSPNAGGRVIGVFVSSELWEITAAKVATHVKHGPLHPLATATTRQPTCSVS